MPSPVTSARPCGNDASPLAGTRRSLRLRHVERVAGTDALRFTFEARDSAGCELLASATALRTGALVDLQADDGDSFFAGTTGRPELDELIAEQVARRLVSARAVEVISRLDREAA